MDLTEKHIENLRALAESKDGLRRSGMPQSHNIRRLVKEDLAEVCGDSWISRVTITDRGRQVLRELDKDD